MGHKFQQTTFDDTGGPLRKQVSHVWDACWPAFEREDRLTVPSMLSKGNHQVLVASIPQNPIPQCVCDY
jgi:hypothetical protein